MRPRSLVGNQAPWRRTLISPSSFGRQREPSGRCTSTSTPGTGRPSEPSLTTKSAAPGIVGEDHADLGCSVHAAQRRAKFVLNEHQRRVVDRFAGKRELSQRGTIIPDTPGVLHHPVMRRGSRQIRRAVVLQRPQQTLGIELAGIGAGLDAKRQRRQRSVPQAVAPGRRGRAKEPVARPQAGAVQRRVHQHDQCTVRVPDRGRHLSRCARGVLKDRQVAGRGLRFIAVRERASAAMNA